jgi:hypothetical protein
MPSMRSKISDAILARLELVTEYNYRNFDTVKILASDFAEWELPGVQIIDLSEVVTHEKARARKDWSLAIEIVMGPTKEGAEPSQKDLWDLMELTEQTLWAVPNLGIPGVVHMILNGTATDLHLLPGLYTGRLDLTVRYYQTLVSEC